MSTPASLPRRNAPGMVDLLYLLSSAGKNILRIVDQMKWLLQAGSLIYDLTTLHSITEKNIMRNTLRCILFRSYLRRRFWHLYWINVLPVRSIFEISSFVLYL